MAASADELLKNNNFQIPLIDLKRFCQDELNTAARLFGDLPETEYNNMVSPRIDKSIFNESAGSRRQTYSGARVSRRRKEPILNSHAKEDSQEISMSSLVNFSSSREKLGTNKNSSKSMLDLVGKFLYIFNKEEKNRLNARSSLSSYASEEKDVLSVPLFKELEEVHNKEVYNVSPNIQKAENICEILKGDPEMEGGILEIQKSFEKAEGLEEDQCKVLDNARPDMPNARKTPQVSKGDSELKGGMRRFKMLAEGLERSQEDRNKVVVDSSPSLAESGNASEVLGRETTGKIWGTRKLLETSEEEPHKVIVNASPHLLVANCTSEVLRGSLEMEEDIEEIKNSFESFEGLQVSDEIIERSGYVRPEQENKMSGEGKIYTQHGLQVQSQERKSCEQVQVSLRDFDRLVEACELQNRGKVYEKQSQVDNFCAELHSYMLNAEGDIYTVANGMDRPKRKRGRPKKKATEWGSAFSIDIKKADCEKELASDAMNQAAERLVSGSRKRVQSGFPGSASEEDAGVHFSSDSRKRVRNGLSRGASKDGNEIGVKSQFYHRILSSKAVTLDGKEVVTLDGKEVSSDASVAGDIIAKPTEAAKDRAINEKCKVDVTEGANAAAMAFYAKENMTNGKSEQDALRQMSYMKEQKLLPADDFLESWKNRLPNGWKVEVGLQRTESGKYDYYHNFVSPDGVHFPELKEISKNESSVCRQESDAKGSSGTNEIEFCNISPPGYRDSNQRTDISYEEDRNDESNNSKQGSPEIMSIPSDLDEARVDAHTYVCKFCGKNFNCYHHYVGHVAAHALTSHRKRGRPRVRGKLQNVPLLKNKEDKDDRIISNENFQTTNVNESDNPDKLKRKVGRPRVSDSDSHKEMHCNTGIQSGSVMFYVNQTGLKGNVNEPQNSNIIDLDRGHGILSGGATALVNIAGPRKPGRARKIKEPICGCCNRDDYIRHTKNDRYDYVNSDCGHNMQSTGAPWLVNTMGPKRKRGRPRIVGVKRKRGRPRIVKRKPGRLRKVQEPICSNDNLDDERHHTDIDRGETDNSPRSCQDVEENLSVCEQSAGFQTSIDRDACEMINGSPRYGDKTQDNVHYFVDTDCDNAMQSAGTPVLVQTVGTKRKTGRPRTVRPKRKPGRPRKIKEPIYSNDNHDNDRNYSGNDRDEANNSFRSYQDVEENLSGFKQSAGLQTDIHQDAREKKDEPPRCGDKTQVGVHCFADTDYRNYSGNDRDEANNSFRSYQGVEENLSGFKQSADLQTDIHQDAREKKDEPPRCGDKTQVGVHCFADTDYRNYSGNDRDEANNSFRSYQGVEENLSGFKQSAGLQTDIHQDAREKKDEPPRCGDKTQVGVHCFADTDCCYATQSAGRPALVNRVGAKRKRGRPKKIKKPICGSNRDDERNCTGNDGDVANNSFWSYEEVKENLSICKQFAGLQTSIDQDACEKKDGLPRYGQKTQDEVHYENSIKFAGALVLADQNGQNNWAGQQRLRDDNKDTVGDSASADASLKRDDCSRLKDEMQAKDMDCMNHSQPHVTQVGEKKKLGWSRKFQAPIRSDSKLGDEINKYSSSCNQDEKMHCQCDNVKDEMRISLDGELNFCKIDQSIHVMAPAPLDRSENFIGMQILGKICQDEEMSRGKTFQYVGLVTNLDSDDQNKWFEQPKVKDDRQDVEPSYARINQLADSKNPVDSTSPLLENIDLDSTLQEYGIYQNSHKTTDEYFAEAGTLYPFLPAVNKGKLDTNNTATAGNAKVSIVDHEIEWDTSQFVVCQWCDQDFDFSSVSHLGSPCSWICPGCKTVNNVDVQNLWTDFEF